MLASLLFALLSVGLQQAPAPAPGSTNANYVVAPQDVLTVTVFNEPQLSGRFRIENDGQFNYPFLGRIQAAGATASEIAAVVKAKLADGYVSDPQVTVDVEQFRSQNVFVMGEVRAPGRYTLTGSVTLVEALAQTGVLKHLSDALHAASEQSVPWTAAVSGAAVALGTNLVNNLPLGLVAASTSHAAQVPLPVTNALLIGIDLGPNLSVTGSLATILWLIALRRERITVSSLQFLRLGAIVMLPALVLSLGAMLLLSH